MALPMLVNGADCGPSNALQNLTKTFDRDRGVQQDQFGAGRAGSSRDAFRTQPAGTPTLDQDAARFFSGQRQNSQLPGLSTFDLSTLHQSLPSPGPQLVRQAQPLAAPAAASSWATDFLMQQPVASATPAPQMAASVSQISSPVGFENRDSVQTWTPSLAGPRMGLMPMFSPPIGQQQPQQSVAQFDATSLDKEFQSFDAFASPAQPIAAEPVPSTSARGVADSDLARTAAELIHAVRYEENPKFKESEFLGLMRQLRDGDVVIDGKSFVPAASASADVKGKSRAEPSALTYADSTMSPEKLSNFYGSLQRSGVDPQVLQTPNIGSGLQAGMQAQRQERESELDAYLRQQNEDYMDYWNSAGQAPGAQEGLNSQSAEWANLQGDWDRFEATATGIRAVAEYQFQAHNPYVLGNSSRTHMMHTGARQAMNESVLELEAAVQRDPSSAEAWFELGVKQQENEREGQAIRALERALALDATHLPAWLALAISYTNEGQRAAAHNAVASWLGAHPRYKAQYGDHQAQESAQEYVLLHEKVGGLVRCLIGVAQDAPEGEMDADVQIALAILLNINEEWDKSGDCFRAALSVRPDDWLLWNRVGATLANSGHADEALQFYNQAIALNPLYIRARYNIGISLINTKRHAEAAEHLLDALVLQESDATSTGDGGQVVTSSSLWDSLRTACQQMHRLDLSAMCERKDLEGFRAAFEAQRVA